MLGRLVRGGAVDVDDGRFPAGELPATRVGSITLRVVDTDRTAGHQAIDQVRIDGAPRALDHSVTWEKQGG